MTAPMKSNHNGPVSRPAELHPSDPLAARCPKCGVFAGYIRDEDLPRIRIRWHEAKYRAGRSRCSGSGALLAVRSA